MPQKHSPDKAFTRSNPLPLPKSLTYKTTLPLSGKQIEYRQFLVSEEKILYMALELEGTDDALVNALRKLIEACCLTHLDVNTLPLADLQWFLIQIRAKSEGKIVDLRYRCRNVIDSAANELNTEMGRCDTRVNIGLDLETVTISKPDHDIKTIILDEASGLGVRMKYPNFEMLAKIDAIHSGANLSTIIGIVAESVDVVFDSDKVYDKFTHEDIIAFVELLNRKQFAQLTEFFEKIPTLRKELPFRCPKCLHEDTIILEGIQAFFV